MSDYIYSRVSTDGQTTDAQLSAFKDKYPAAKVVSEQASGARRRPLLESLVAMLEPGDRLIVAALDRLGRKTSEVLALIEDLSERGITLISDREGVDYSTPAGRLVTQILASVAEMERAMNSERTRAGLENARAKGKRIGRPPKFTPAQIEEALELVLNGTSVKRAARSIGMSYSYLHDILRLRNTG